MNKKNTVKTGNKPFNRKVGSGIFFARNSCDDTAMANVSTFFPRAAIQPKLRIGSANDMYEREADAVASKIMRQEDNEEELQTRNSFSIGRQICPECHEADKLQRKKEERADKSLEAPSIVYNVLQSVGSPLPKNTLSFMENRVGYDFSNVRIHNGSEASKSAQSINALAYTYGNDIVFNRGQYSPGTTQGKRLLAHELTHVVQQSGSSRKKINRSKHNFKLTSVGIQSMIQCDLAIPAPRPAAVGRVLTPTQIADAITFNNRVLGSIANSAAIIRMIRDVIGISPLPAVVDADFVNGVVQWQANFGLGQDGRMGPRTARPLFREIGAEGVGRGQVSRPPRYNPAGPINVGRAAPRRAPFTMSAEFESDPATGIFPSCCEVRQEILWDATFRAASIAAGNGTVPHGGFDPADRAGVWIEDRDPTGTRRLGYRSGRFAEGIPGNRYLDPTGAVNQAFGHRYEGSDNPLGLAADRGSWNFRLGVYDMCNGNRLLRYSPTLVLNWL